MHLRPCLSALPRLITGNRILVSVLSLLPSLLTAQILSLTHYSDLIEVEDAVTYSSGHAYFTSSWFYEGGFADPVPKFDPAMGILEKINISIVLQWNVYAELQVWEVLDENEPHSAGFDTSGNPLYFGLYYTPTPTPESLNSFSEVAESVDLFFTKEDSSDLSESQTTDVFADSLDDFVTVYDPANGIDNISLDDFVGAGSIVGLRPGMTLPFSGIFTLDNVSEAETWVDAALDGWIEVEYVYQIPESRHVGAVFALAALALVFVRLRRR